MFASVRTVRCPDLVAENSVRCFKRTREVFTRGTCSFSNPLSLCLAIDVAVKFHSTMASRKDFSEVSPFLQDYEGDVCRVSDHDSIRTANAVELFREISSKKKPYLCLRFAIYVLAIASYTFLVVLVAAKIVENSHRCETSFKKL